MLRNGLAHLMREKRAQDITVRELAERCDITRGTFYIHYRNVFDMVDHIEDELIDEFRRSSSRSLPGRCSILRSSFWFSCSG